jgi:hypothetical protein
MSGIFTQPKVPRPTPVVNPEDTANRAAATRLRQLSGQGANSTALSSWASGSQTGGQAAPTLTGMG